MNLILLFPDDFTSPTRVRLAGRRLRHVTDVHRAELGAALTVGVANGRVGKGTVARLDADALELDVVLNGDPQAALPVTLVLALPRPKVLNRVVAAATSMGVKRLFFINAWRVEKSYWSTPRLSEDNLRHQALLGLEQARDTVFPELQTRRFFRRFVEEELPELMRGTMALVAHPGASMECPRGVDGPVSLVLGPEGGFIAEEVASLETVGFQAVHLGERILRVETVVPAILGRLF
jgi:16S rRNA (uracil1498-N3)-methyltransferase